MFAIMTQYVKSSLYLTDYPPIEHGEKYEL